MSTDLSSYRRDLVLALRMRDVPGERIGEIVAEVESHVAETGEDPREAFGAAKEYAAAFPAPRRTGRLVVLAVTGATAGYLVASGVFGIVSGEAVGPLPAWAVLALGVLAGVPVVVAAVRSASRVRDPLTGAELVPGPRAAAAGWLAFALLLVAAVALVTALTG